MTHGPHESLPGYSPAQILKDGCHECQERGKSPGAAIAHMDSQNFAAAWERAAAWQKDGSADDVSHAEAPLLRALWAVQVKLESRGFPVGAVPTAF